MVIERMDVGAHGRKSYYAVCADAQETGDKLHEIARFDTLDVATAVLRYMRGDSLSEADEYRAKEAIKKASAPTVESKRTRKAE